MWKKYPDLRMALSEGSMGWIPYRLERADFTYRHHHEWTMTDYGGGKPSDIFRQHVITCFIEDEFGLRNLADIGEDKMSWECDYPHSDCTWPGVPGIFHAQTRHLTDAKIDKTGHLNAMREFSYDPFFILGRENCTVGALWAQAKYLSVKPRLGIGGARPVREIRKPASSGNINKMFADADAEAAL